MSKGNVIFDFDSTIIKLESLEVILKNKLEDCPEKMVQIKNLTDKGMSGEINFHESISQRLAIAAPDYVDLINFYQNNSQTVISDGIKLLVSWLQDNEIDVYIISGGLLESILPFAKALGIPQKNVHAVRLLWDQAGKFIGINQDDSFSQSKSDGAKGIAHLWQKPSVIVGDGYTDYQLYESGLVDYFIAYIEHQEREKVVNLAKYIAQDSNVLKKYLDQLLSINMSL